MRVWLGEWVTDSGAARLGWAHIWVETLSQLESSVHGQVAVPASRPEGITNWWGRSAKTQGRVCAGGGEGAAFVRMRAV